MFEHIRLLAREVVAGLYAECQRTSRHINQVAGPQSPERDRHIAGMAATQLSRPFQRPGWVYEEKVDGWQALPYKDGAGVRLISRNGRDLTRRFAELAATVAGLELPTLIVGRRDRGLRPPTPLALRVAARAAEGRARDAADDDRF